MRSSHISISACPWRISGLMSEYRSLCFDDCSMGLAGKSNIREWVSNLSLFCSFYNIALSLPHINVSTDAVSTHCNNHSSKVAAASGNIGSDPYRMGEPAEIAGTLCAAGWCWVGLYVVDGGASAMLAVLWCSLESDEWFNPIRTDSGPLIVTPSGRPWACSIPTAGRAVTPSHNIWMLSRYAFRMIKISRWFLLQLLLISQNSHGFLRNLIRDWVVLEKCQSFVETPTWWWWWWRQSLG